MLLKPSHQKKHKTKQTKNKKKKTANGYYRSMSSEILALLEN